MCSCHVIFSFFKLHQFKYKWNIWWITRITFFKMKLCNSEHPYLISIAFHIAKVHILFSSYQRSNKMCSCHVIFSFFKLHQFKYKWNIWWITRITFLKMKLCNSEHPYLISIAFHIAKVYCCSCSNPAYAASCLPVEPFSWASSENVYKTIIRMSMGWVFVVLWYQMVHSVFCMNMYEHTFSKVANHQIRHQASRHT